ncbi:MAG: TauD/TfdA family dioxygenase [Rhizobium sp.]|nr:TauD/TfdA family dioxygenase [Rhizobium sp.]
MIDDRTPEFWRLIESRGWAHFSAGTSDHVILRELNRAAYSFGTPVSGRNGSKGEILRPQAQDSAHPRSLSSSFGLGAFPLHAELSHRLRPCRYLLLACLDPGDGSSPTTMLDWRTLQFTSDQLQLLNSAPVLVRAGRQSFYSTILPVDRAFLRYDLGCVEAVDARGTEALRTITQKLKDARQEFFHWALGDILVIDNWRVLHGRAPCADHSNRTLARVLVDAY